MTSSSDRAAPTASAGPGGAPAPKLLDRLRDHLRTRHYSIRTETAYVDWARRFILFHGKRHPQEMGAVEVEAFLTHLAVQRQVSASTQNQAKAAILYLYKQVLGVDLPWLEDVVQAKTPRRLPVVLTATEVRTLLLHMQGTTGLIAQLLYGTGMRLLEALRLRVKDVEFARREIVIREGKGNKDRITVLPENLIGPLQQQLQKARALHEKDVEAGFGRVHLPHALAVKYAHADRSWAWQWVFPSPVRSVDPRPDAVTGALLERRHHVYPESVQRAVREAARLAQIARVRTLVDASGARHAIRLQAEGDIGLPNIASVAAAGVDDIVVGRALFGSDDWAGAVTGLREAIAAARAARVPA